MQDRIVTVRGPSETDGEAISDSFSDLLRYIISPTHSTFVIPQNFQCSFTVGVTVVTVLDISYSRVQRGTEVRPAPEVSYSVCLVLVQDGRALTSNSPRLA
jgi:hypothetical protein